MVPKISVIMPSLNVADYIEKCLTSVMNQTLADIEILCIDAQSSDGTREIIAKLSAKDGRIRLIDTDIRSYGAQVNIGLKIACGEYVAFVETDDSIIPEMMEDLYKRACEFDLDFSKGQRFNILLLNTGALRSEVHNYGLPADIFDHLLEKKDFPTLQYFDENIWNGIYRRSFLLENNIFAQETPGAAFQDLGLLQQVYRYAKKGWYSSKAYYMYLCNRPGSSSVSVKGALYVYNEFRWLFDDLCLFNGADIEFQKACIKRLVKAFTWEYGITSYMSNPFSFDELKTFYKWFISVIEECQKQKLIERKEYPDYLWLWLQLLVESDKSYLDYFSVWHTMQQYETSVAYRNISDKPVVIFGSGKWGKLLKKELDKELIEVLAFCDNNSQLWGSQTDGCNIYSPDYCYSTFSDAVYYIANKKNVNDIYHQLIYDGITENRIVIYNLKNG